MIRFWQALDERLGHVEPTWWGAVVTAPAFPAVWDANYARVDMPAGDLTLAEVTEALAPALARVGTDVFHVVSFHAEDTTGLLSELSSRGHRLTWDLVMEHDLGGSRAASGAPVEELEPDGALWERVEASMALFGIEPALAAQLRELEIVAHATSGKRWFGVRNDAGAIVSLAALAVLEGVGYLDNVVTFPEGRRKGFASATAARVLAEARTVGADRVFLLADPDARPVVDLYERLGFNRDGWIASTRGPATAPGEVNR